jgi:F-type H+-transporting ATPase subunit gamma
VVSRAVFTFLLVQSYSLAFLTHADVQDTEMKKPLLVTCSSDRGLCGGIHSGLAKMTKKELKQVPETRCAVLGVKARSKLQYDFAKQIDLSFDGVCKFPPSWLESALIADVILQSDSQNDGLKVIYNKFKSVIAFEPVSVKVPTIETIEASSILLLNCREAICL